MEYKSRILVVDDQALMRNHLHRLLANEGYDLEFAENGQQGLDKISSFKPDLILLDVRMPLMDGFEVCRRVRANPATADIPIIMITAFDDRHARMEGIEAGADDFIPKPYDSLELRARVRTITRLNRYRRLMDEKAKFQLVAELSESGYLLINNQDECVFANHQARMYLGLQLDMSASIDRTFLDLARDGYQMEPDHAWVEWPGWAANNESRFLVRPETKTTPALWLQVDTLDHLLSGNEMVWVIGLRDVTTQMTARQDMWKFQRAIHHKMRTPLIGMYSGVQFLANYLNELPPEDVQSLLNTALEHGERLRSAVEDVLRYIDTQNFAHNDDQVVIEELTSTIAQIAETMGIDNVKILCEDDLRTEKIVLSHESIEVIFWELLENARKFHPAETPEVQVSIEQGPKPNTAMIRVLDDGAHLTPEQIQHIWRPYYQSEKSFTGEVQGMGLGLPTVASVVWGVGGKCSLQNRADSLGLEISLTLPLSEDKPSIQPMAPGQFDLE